MALVNPKTGKGWVLMTNRCYFQFDTRRRLRRFFTSSEGWSSPNKRLRPPRMHDATPIIAIRNAIPATAILRRECAIHWARVMTKNGERPWIVP
jgi:hypothetical protein